MSHLWTSHGYPCCPSVDAAPGVVMGTCGGPWRCTKCRVAVVEVCPRWDSTWTLGAIPEAFMLVGEFRVVTTILGQKTPIGTVDSIERAQRLARERSESSSNTAWIQVRDVSMWRNVGAEDRL